MRPSRLEPRTLTMVLPVCVACGCSLIQSGVCLCEADVRRIIHTHITNTCIYLGRASVHMCEVQGVTAAVALGILLYVIAVYLHELRRCSVARSFVSSHALLLTPSVPCCHKCKTLSAPPCDACVPAPPHLVRALHKVLDVWLLGTAHALHLSWPMRARQAICMLQGGAVSMDSSQGGYAWWMVCAALSLST